MTIIIARRFSNVSVVLSDTMVSDVNAKRPDDIPGTLKTLVVDMRTSISYAGDIEWALLNIRRAKNVGIINANALEILRQSTVDDRCEYIVATHTTSPVLMKIWCGHVSENLPECSIGSPSAYEIFRRFQEEKILTRVSREPQPDPQYTFQSDWTDFLFPRDHLLPRDVGGFAICQLCYPKGYCYANIASASDWTLINLSETPSQEELDLREVGRKSGLTSFQYQVNGIARGTSVLGAYLIQAETGFIYNPLGAGKAVTLLRTANPTGFWDEVRRRGVEAGGQIVD